MQKRVRALLSGTRKLSLYDLIRAMQLQDWRDEDRDEAVAAVDKVNRDDLVARFRGAAAAMLEKGGPDTKLAAVNRIGEMGAKIRDGGSRQGLGRKLAPELIPLLASNDGALRQASARALGQILPDPASATAALGKLLDRDDVADRRAAAAGLVHMLKGCLENQRRYIGVSELTREDITKTGAAVLPVVGRGLRDSDGEVRALSLQALDLEALLIAELIPDPPHPLPFPPPGRKPTREEHEEITAYAEGVEAERAFILPMARALAEQNPALLSLLDKGTLLDAGAACKALEDMANARVKLVGKAASVPRLDDKPNVKLSEDPLLKPMRAAVPLLAAKLTHPEVKVRLAAVYVFENLGAEAAPVADALVRALADDSSFVRWGAARVLGKMAPRAAAKTVPALAQCLDDENADVRVTAAAALERFGPAGNAAVANLAKSIGHKDAETRFWSAKALSAIGPGAKDAVPSLITALSDSQLRVRITAAQALGKTGVATAPVIDALKKALLDEDDEVRQAAADALIRLK